jgi:phosphoribosylaminoimidazole-succinocarboxamide synthase
LPHHLVSDRVEDFPEPIRAHRELLAGRAALVRRAEMLPVECVVRGYLAGSGLKEYRREGRVCGIELPAGLVEASELPEPIFTPATKAESGHDENISFEAMVTIVGEKTARRLRALTIELYLDASAYARERGIIIADTKLEFGFVDGELTLCDEVLTPDSSRFWPAASYEPGRPQPSFDKQYVRDFLEAQPWDKAPPAPALSEAVVAGTRERYLEALRILTGRGLD